MPRLRTRASLVAAIALLGCGDELDRLPGAYVGVLDSARQLSRAENIRGNDQGSFDADVTGYAGGESRSGATVTIREVGEVAGNRVYEADLAGICVLRFEGYEGGRLADGLQSPRCTCAADRVVEGGAVVLGSLHQGRLELTVSVKLTGSGYTGGCTHHFVADAPR
ncbi:MAG: hypothetical protein R3A79_19625 [Nannocystaceae bacterium]